METNFRQDFTRGIRIGTGIFAALVVGWAGVSFATAAWGALPTVSSGSTLSATAWNDMVGQVNGLASIMKADATGHVGFWGTPGITGWTPDVWHRVIEFSGLWNDVARSDAVISLTNNRATATTGDQLWAIIFSSESDVWGIHSAIASYSKGSGWPNGFGGNLEFYTKGDNVSPHQARMTITQSGSIGIGTALPNSRLQVVGDYIQIPNVSWAAPLASDCDQAAEAGRMVIYTANTGTPSNSQLYVCPQGGGWVAK